MIREGLGLAYILNDDGGRTPVEMNNPRAALEAAEENAANADAIACAIEAVRDWLAWIFEAGPDPVRVVRRLVACTNENAPWLLRGMSRREARALSPETSEQDALKKLFGVVGDEVQRSLAQAYRREGMKWDAAQPPEVKTLEMRLIDEQAIDASDALMRGRALEQWLARVWDGGPRVKEAAKAVYIEARAYTPQVLLNMSGEEIATMFGQGRAAESARVKHRVNDFLARAGFRNTQLRFQKSASACRTYAKRAKGNRNRAGSARADAA